MWLFDIFKKKSGFIIEPKEKIIFQGHDMDVWHYIGRSECSYHTEKSPDKKLAVATMLLFAKKKNLSIRSISMLTDDSFHYTKEYFVKHHTWYHTQILPWLAGEIGIIHVVNQWPSVWSKDYALKNYKWEWSDSTKSWVSSSDAKYNAATEEQKKKKPEKKKKGIEPVVEVVDETVVNVDFGKKPEKPDPVKV